MEEIRELNEAELKLYNNFRGDFHKDLLEISRSLKKKYPDVSFQMSGYLTSPRYGSFHIITTINDHSLNENVFSYTQDFVPYIRDSARKIIQNAPANREFFDSLMKLINTLKKSYIE